MKDAHEYIRELEGVIEEILSVPMWVDEATVPRGKTPDDAPNQVVVNMSVSWARILKAREVLSKKPASTNIEK